MLMLMADLLVVVSCPWFSLQLMAVPSGHPTAQDCFKYTTKVAHALLLPGSIASGTGHPSKSYLQTKCACRLAYCHWGAGFCDKAVVKLCATSGQAPKQAAALLFTALLCFLPTLWSNICLGPFSQ